MDILCYWVISMGMEPCYIMWISLQIPVISKLIGCSDTILNYYFYFEGNLVESPLFPRISGCRVGQLPAAVVARNPAGLKT